MALLSAKHTRLAVYALALALALAAAAMATRALARRRRDGFTLKGNLEGPYLTKHKIVPPCDVFDHSDPRYRGGDHFHWWDPNHTGSRHLGNGRWTQIKGVCRGPGQCYSMGGTVIGVYDDRNRRKYVCLRQSQLGSNASKVGQNAKRCRGAYGRTAYYDTRSEECFKFPQSFITKYDL